MLRLRLGVCSLRSYKGTILMITGLAEAWSGQVLAGSCEQCVVRNRAICSGLDSSELQTLNKISHHQKLSAGQSLLWEGENTLVVANVIEGVVKLTVSNADGREQIVGLMFASDFIGRPFGKESPFNATAVTDVEVCVFHRSSFDQFAAEHPNLQQKLLHRTLDELDRTRRWMLLLGRKSAEGKLASFLLEMTERLQPFGCVGNAPTSQFELPFGRQQIADVLGLTIETVSRQLTRMRDDAVIELPSRREINILNRQALEIMAS